ncbi:hypothetical protein GCM10027160_44010 [Streptomyces calidiresistens]
MPDASRDALAGLERVGLIPLTGGNRGDPEMIESNKFDSIPTHFNERICEA